MPQTLFDGFNRFGDRILLGIDRKERPASKYKWLLGQINELLKTTHGMVVEKLNRIEKAVNIETASVVLEELRFGDLQESFRVEGMCDTFFGLGVALAELNDRSNQEGAFSSAEMTDIADMAHTLTNREAEVAGIYVRELQGLTRQIGHISPKDLPEIKKKTHKVKKLLTDQMSDFDTKAKKFLRLSTPSSSR